KSYIGLNDNDMARSYLMRCLDVSKDAKTSVTAGLLLAEIYSNSGDLNGAEKQYQDVLKISADNAQANFQLGELYASRGDMTKARSYWRDSYNADTSNQKVRARLGK
ncbi:MAG: tetratricopeptide repeat protein, partial [Treponema sp.]|nr:tetratricopeptide repeat protein [Treponema sp.]